MGSSWICSWPAPWTHPCPSWRQIQSLPSERALRFVPLVVRCSVPTTIPWQMLGFTRITPQALSQLPEPPLKVVVASDVLQLLLWGHSSPVPPMQLSSQGCVFWWAVVVVGSPILLCLGACASPCQWLMRKNCGTSRRWCLRSSLSNFSPFFLFSLLSGSLWELPCAQGSGRWDGLQAVCSVLGHAAQFVL